MSSLLLAASLLSFINLATAQETAKLNDGFLNDSYLKDNNGNGVVEILAFGDSLTRGVGDFTGSRDTVFEALRPTSEAGYPLRIETLLEIPVSNLGVGGEIVANTGLERFAREIPARRPDIVILNEGVNDARSRQASGVVFTSLQTMINIATASGAQPILWTIPPSCCGHFFLTQSAESYNEEIRRLAVLNNVPLGDVFHAYFNICGGRDCFLLNRPEGLHPNSEGYDVIGENIIAALLNIDIFAPGGAAKLEQALNLVPGSVRTTPDPA